MKLLNFLFVRATLVPKPRLRARIRIHGSNHIRSDPKHKEWQVMIWYTGINKRYKTNQGSFVPVPVPYWDTLSHARQCCGSGSIPYVFWHLYNFLPLKNDVNVPVPVPSKSKCQCKVQWRELQDPDPLVKGTEPWIPIRTKMSRIRITDSRQIKHKL